jgi:hypothetical protein
MHTPNRSFSNTATGLRHLQRTRERHSTRADPTVEGCGGRELAASGDVREGTGGV